MQAVHIRDAINVVAHVREELRRCYPNWADAEIELEIPLVLKALEVRIREAKL